MLKYRNNKDKTLIKLQKLVNANVIMSKIVLIRQDNKH